MSSANWGAKRWDKILEDISSGEDSDAGDSLNAMSVQRNAHRVAELLHGAVPSLDATQMRTPPMGANNMDLIRQSFAASMYDVSHPRRGTPRGDRPASTVQAASVAKEVAKAAAAAKEAVRVANEVAKVAEGVANVATPPVDGTVEDEEGVLV